MTTTIISANIIGAPVQVSFTAAGDSLLVLPGVTLASTTLAAFGSVSFANISVTVLGTVSSATVLDMAGDSGSLVIGSTGTVLCTLRGSANAAINLGGSNTTLINDGLISSSGSLGILASGHATAINTGTISASSPVFIGLFGDAQDSFINSGVVMAGNFDDAGRGTRFNNGVIAEGADCSVTNLAGGQIIATSSEGAGIMVQGFANGTLVRNGGLVHSEHAFGVDFNELGAADIARLINTGVIEGQDGAFRGGVVGDLVSNTGRMVGDVIMQGGDDLFQNRGGSILGDWLGGAGADTYRGGLAADVSGTIFGEADNDTLVGGQLDDVINGGTENDLVQGGQGDDRLLGDLGVDRLVGNVGDDTLDGGAGADRMLGGAGADTFLFATTADFGDVATTHDIITDFVHLSDILSLAAIDAKTTVAGNQAFVFLAGVAFSNVAGQLRYDAATGVLEGDTNGDGLADFKLDLVTKPTLTVDDFLL